MPHNFPYYAQMVVKIYQQFAPILHCCFQVSRTSDLPSYYTCSVAPYLISAEPHPQVNFILLHWPYAQGFLHQISAQLLYINQIWLDLNMWHNFSPTRSVTMLGVPFFQNLMITIRNNWQQASSSYICVSQIHMVGIASSRLLHSLLHI